MGLSGKPWLMALAWLRSPRSILALVGVASMVYFGLRAVSCRSGGIPVRGRIVMVQPAPRWTPPADFSVTLPDSPRASRVVAGPPECVQTLIPESPKEAKRIEDRFGVDLKATPLIALKDLPRLPQGGDLAVTVREGKAEVTARAFTPPLFDFDWSHDLALDYRRLYPGGGALDYRAFSYQPVSLVVKGRLRISPAIGHVDIPGTTIDGPYVGVTARLSLGRH